jgi:ERCC4-type nuclease
MQTEQWRRTAGLHPQVRIVVTHDALADAMRTLYPTACADGLIRFEPLRVFDAAIVLDASPLDADDANIVVADGDAAAAPASLHVLCGIERKTVADLVASQLDGRWQSQHVSMMASGAERRVYLIESAQQALFAEQRDLAASPVPHGSPKTAALRSYKTLMKRLTIAQRRDGYELLFSGAASAEASARMIFERLFFEEASYAGEPPEKRSAPLAATPLDTALSVVGHHRKQALLTEDVFFVLALAQIPDVGEHRAKLVAARFASLPALIDALKGGASAKSLDISGVGPKTVAAMRRFILNDGSAPPPAPKKKRSRPLPPTLKTTASYALGSDSDDDDDLDFVLATKKHTKTTVPRTKKAPLPDIVSSSSHVVVSDSEEVAPHDAEKPSVYAGL